MRFRCFGDLDCPDWVLAEINTLSKMSSVKIKILCQLVAKSLAGDSLDEDKAQKLLTDAKLGVDDMKAAVSALATILTSSARYSVEEDDLSNEMQQLGLPKEHATALCRVYNDNRSSITAQLEASSLRLSILESFTCEPLISGDSTLTHQWRLPTSQLTIHIKDKIKNRDVTQNVILSPAQLKLLHTALKEARKEMSTE